MKKLITVIVLSYKSPALYEAIDSVLEQDYDNIQLIINDDATHGFDREMIEAYIYEKNASNIKECIVIQNADNLGTVKSLNNAISKSKGELIFTLAGDDCFADNLVLSEWSKAFEDTLADIMVAFCEEGFFMTRRIGIRPYEKQAEILKTKSARELFEPYSRICTRLLYSKNKGICKKYGPHDERFRLIEDAPMILKIWSQNGVINFWDRVAIKHRTGGVSSSENISVPYENDLKIYLNW